MTIHEAKRVVRDLLHHRQQVIMDADGADDRIYTSEDEWEAIAMLLKRSFVNQCRVISMGPMVRTWVQIPPPDIE